MLTIITPCSRQANIPKLYDSIMFDNNRIQKFIKEINDHLDIIIQRMVYCLCFKIKRSNNVHYSTLCRYLYERIDNPPLFWENGRIDWNLLFPNMDELSHQKLENFKLENFQKLENLSNFKFDYYNFLKMIYNTLKERCNIYKEELIQKTMHPNRILKYLEQGYEIDDIDNFI